MKYKCFYCNREYSTNKSRMPLNDNNELINEKDKRDEYCCPHCDKTLIFMPVPKNEVTSVDAEFFGGPNGVVMKKKMINSSGYNPNDFKSIGFFPTQILASRYYNAIRNQKYKKDDF